MREWAVPGYTELRELGSGGFGEVVLARHDATGTPVAIKYLRRTVLADPEWVRMFRTEAVVMAAVDDQNVVRLYEYVESPAGAAIVMELVDGVSLREILTRHGKTTAEAALVVLQGSLFGLAAAHARGVVHRDYKPENVLVNGYGVSKLTDFGIAARAGDRAIAAGTLAYAPPEQFDGAPASPATDVYAATATFYECLTGHPPFAGPTAEALIRQHRTEPVPMDPVPEPLQQLVASGMAKDPRYRPADAAAFASGLHTVAAGAYGPEWQSRGRSHLGEAALLLAALWPSGAAPAVHGSTVEHVRLSHGAQQASGAQQAGGAQSTGPAQQSLEAERARNAQSIRATRHRWHLRHILHLEHLAHERYLRRLRAATAVAAGAAVVAAVATVALTSRSSPPSSGGSAGHTVVSVYPVTLATIPLTATASETADDDVFVRYLDGSDSTAQLTGQASSAPDGAVVRLYAQPFPYASAPVPAGAVTLDPAGGSDSYTFQVTPAIATRYQVRLFSTATATTPIAVSPVTTIYVIASFSESGGGTCNGSTCQLTETVTQPPSTLPTEMAKHWYVYIGSYTSSGQPPATLDLDTSAVVSAARQTSPDSYTRTITYTYTGTGSVYQLFCFKDTEAADGTGLPNASGCGDQQVSTSSYLG